MLKIEGRVGQQSSSSAFVTNGSGSSDDHEILGNLPVPFGETLPSNIRDSNRNSAEMRTTITLLKFPLRLT